ncbi:hypothetical protein D3C85_1485290 [compost metagenome]
MARKFCLLGATEIEIADLFNVSIGALNKWKKKYPEFVEALWRGKEVANAEVASKLYKRAIGYSHQELDLRVVKGELAKTIVTKHYPPDVAACIFWLKNRDKTRWRDKHETEHTGNVTYDRLTDEELEHKIKQLEAPKQG